MTDPRRALEVLIRDYADIGARARGALRVHFDNSKIGYNVSVVGIVRSKRILALTAPVTPEGSLAAVMKGQLLTCRWFSATTAFRFRATVSRVSFEPIPLIHIDLPPIVERRTMRGVPRGLCALRAMLKTPRDVEAIMVDLSTTGARVAVSEEAKLEKNQELTLIVQPTMLRRDYELIIRCQITAPAGAIDPKHPHVRFYGINFLDVSDYTMLTLHAYVQECLVAETDVLSLVLLGASKEVATLD
jgi:hypothetical protein